MCTAATYKTEVFYFGRTLDYEFSYGDEVTVTPRKFPLRFRHMGNAEHHYAIIGMAYARREDIRCIMTPSTKRDSPRRG